MPSVSVIVPNYNHSKYLRKRIDSIINQTFQDFELIILDDTSTDNSKEIIEQYRNHPKVKSIIFNESNSGSPFNQWKKGVSLASGKYIWIAESDDLVDLDFLEKAIQYEADFIFSRIVDIDEQGNKMDTARVWFDIFSDLDWDKDFFKDGMRFFEYLKERCIIPNISSLVFKKSFFEKFSYVFKDMKYCGDWLFYLNCATNEATFQYNANSTSYFRQHSQTTRWQNKDVFKPLEERFICLEFIRKHSDKKLVLEKDILDIIGRIRTIEIFYYLIKNPKILIKHANFFLSMVLLKLKRRTIK